MARRARPRRRISNPSEARTATVAVLGICAAAIGPATSGAQTVVAVHEEPRHRLVFQSDELRILDIGFEPGDTTLFHTHDRPIAYVEIDATVVNQQRLGGSWGRVSETATPPRRPPGRVSWNENYADAPVTHRVTAIGPGAFRLIGIINRGPGVLEPRAGDLGSTGEPDAWSRYFSRVSHDLGAAESMEWTNGPLPVVLVLASEAVIGVTSHGPEEERRTIQGPGAFAVLEPGHTYRIVNTTQHAAILAFVEVR